MKKLKEDKAQGGERRETLTIFVIIVTFPMADGKRPRDEESSAPPRGLSQVCREFF